MKTLLEVCLGLLLLAVAVNCGYYEYHDYNSEWQECYEDRDCEIKHAFFGTDETECCDGECKQHCDEWWHGLLFFLLAMGCCLGCLATIGGVVYCAAYAAHKNSSVQNYDPTIQRQNVPAYAVPAYGSPPAYYAGAPASDQNAAPLPGKI